MFNSNENSNNNLTITSGYGTSGHHHVSPSKYRGDESTALISIHDGSQHKSRQTYRTHRDEDESLNHHDSTKKLEAEFETVRSQLYSSKMKVRDRSRELSDQKHLNSDLKAKLREKSSTPNVSAFKSTTLEVEIENAQLEYKARSLADQVQQAEEIKPQISHAYSLYDEINMQKKLSDKENIGFMLKSQNGEFEHLKKLLIIFQEENIRMNKLLTAGLAPSHSDVEFIRNNIVQVRNEIDAILNGRHELSLKMHAVQTRIEYLNKENDDLKAQVITLLKGGPAGPDPRDQKINELEDTILILKRDLQWAQITRPDAGMVYRIQHENSTLLHEVAKLRDQNNLLDHKLRDSLQIFEMRSSTRGEHLQDPYTMTINYELHKDNHSPGKRSNIATELTFHSASGKSRLLDTDTKGKWSFSQERVGGNVSAEELQKLQQRVEEFGECNQEIENLIYRLRAMIKGGSEDYYVGSSSPSSSREYKHQQSREFKQLVDEMRARVDILCAEKAGGSQEAPELLKYLQRILKDSVGVQQLVEQQEEVLLTNQKIATELTSLRQLHVALEQQYSSLVKINCRNESYIEELMQQLQQFKKGLKVMTEDRDLLKHKFMQSNSPSQSAY
jgi:hypothetical protein